MITTMSFLLAPSTAQLEDEKMAEHSPGVTQDVLGEEVTMTALATIINDDARALRRNSRSKARR